MHDHQLLRGPGQGHVQVVGAACALGEEGGRFDDHHLVELQALGAGHGEQADLAVQRRVAHTEGPGRQCAGQRAGQGVLQQAGRDDGAAALLGQPWRQGPDNLGPVRPAGDDTILGAAPSRTERGGAAEPDAASTSAASVMIGAGVR